MATEKRLIDANVILKEKTVLWDTALGFCDCVLVEDIDNAPTVDAVEVVHGRWILKETCGKHTEKFHCSVCNKIPKSLCTEIYCPNCGAKMDGDGNG